MPIPRLQVFCSHVNTESLVADFLHERITQDFLGLVEVFNSSNTFNTLAGQAWLDQLTEGLKKSDLHLVLCSAQAITRSWINFEAGAARVRGIPIVPLCYRSLTPAQLPIPFAMYEWLGITTPEGWQKLYKTISDELGTNIPQAGFTDYAAKIAQLENCIPQTGGDARKIWRSAYSRCGTGNPGVSQCSLHLQPTIYGNRV